MSATVCKYPSCDEPVWQDPNGSFSSYCGRTHQAAMNRILNTGQLCKNCGTQPRFIDNGRTHEFCGRRCAATFRNNGNLPTNATSVSPQGGPGQDVCRLSGCTRPVFVNRNGEPSQYCSQSHRIEAVQNGKAEACLFCYMYPKVILNGKQSDFCSKKCRLDTEAEAPLILEINPRHTAFENVVTQFNIGWKHPTPTPTIIKVWKIFGSKDKNDDFFRYKLSTERRTNLDSGNTRRRWHGTIRSCQVGDSADQNRLCNEQSCSLCSIIESSFNLVHVGERTSFGRFGEGIYTSATSSKANDYVMNLDEAASPYKAMLLNEVVLGKAIKLTVTDESIIEPPKGYDSVIGEPGGDLNYDEAIVYKNEAIRPLFLVIYQHI